VVQNFRQEFYEFLGMNKKEKKEENKKESEKIA
jgi:hypothetical protein